MADLTGLDGSVCLSWLQGGERAILSAGWVSWMTKHSAGAAGADCHRMSLECNTKLTEKLTFWPDNGASLKSSWDHHHHLGNTGVYKRFDGNVSKGCWGISVRQTHRSTPPFKKRSCRTAKHNTSVHRYIIRFITHVLHECSKSISARLCLSKMHTATETLHVKLSGATF